MAFGRVTTESRTGRRGQPAGTDMPVPANSAPGAGATGPVAGGVPVARYGTLLGELLVRNGALSEGTLDESLDQQQATGRRLGALLTEMGVVTERDLARALAEQVGLELADLTHQAPEPEVAELLGESRARSLQAIPLTVLPDGRVQVALSDPSPEVAEEVLVALGRPAQLLVGAASEVRRAIDSTFRALSAVGDQVAAFSATTEVRTVVHRTDVDDSADDAPVVRVVNAIITQALRDRASDIHVEPQDGRVRVRYRIDGALHEVLELPAEMGPAVASRIKIMGGMNIVERRRPQDGQIATTVDGRGIDIRVATMGNVWGEKVVMRLLDKSRSVKRLRDLGMPPATHEAFAKMIRSPYGMVICAGPTGSGKTTTLYASMSEVNDADRNITTIEDPVEYVFSSINQIQINEAAGVTFAAGLKSILRHDPDMILVGEMRDVETARIAVQSALTGHFVLSSLHATDSVAALYRFLDMGIEAFLVASSVVGVVGQRLVRKMCSYCRVPYEPTADELAFYRASGGPSKDRFWVGEGCHYCSRTGYSDRVGVYELLTVTEQMRELLVRPNPSHDEMRRLAISQGLVPLRDGGIHLVERDETTIAEILRSIYMI
ncbi:GspE/PulE family protein [Cellulomonas endophytica]|uniref:GspE/PulE family protein n=1 Tax=Cellulomonas endophytica TaxID=2494735 RepID=UPI00196A3363|nr:GspE/PulE family protein [Cellulomonas endophytica]